MPGGFICYSWNLLAFIASEQIGLHIKFSLFSLVNQ